MEFIKKITDFVTSKDGIIEPSATKLHFNNDTKIRSLVGGFLTLVIKCYVIYLTFTSGKKMFDYSAPTVIQIEGKLPESKDDVSIKATQLSRTILEIWDGKGDNYDSITQTVPLNRDSRKYVHVNVRNVH